MKLSICIPTYNRLAELKSCLEFVIPQVTAVPAGTVEIVIINNASTDGTAEFIDTLPSQYPFVRVFHNSANLGFDGNTVKCIEYATGEYMALLSDDDRYLDGQVDSILHVISKQDYVLIALNYYSFTMEVYRPYQTYVSEEDICFSQARDIINYGTVGHFSGLIFRSHASKEILAKIPDNDPLSMVGRSRGVYFEVALRMAYSSELPAYFIGKRRLAVRIPHFVDYDEIQNLCIDNCRFFTRLFEEGVISFADLAFRYNAVLNILPQLIIRCTPNMSTAEIERVTHDLQVYIGTDPRFYLKSLPLLWAARFAPMRWCYKVSYCLARFIKRTLKGAR